MGGACFDLGESAGIYLVIRAGADAHPQLVPMPIAARGMNPSTRLRGRHVQAVTERHF
jgi:hypothetical protein